MQESRTNAQDNYHFAIKPTPGAKMAEKMMNIHGDDEWCGPARNSRRRPRTVDQTGYFDDNEETPEPSSQDIPILYEELRVNLSLKV